MPKRFLAIALFAALVALPATIADASSVLEKASAQGRSMNVAYGTKRAHDWTRPKPTIKRAVGQRNPTSRSAVRLTVSFSEPVHGFTATDVKLSGTVGTGKAIVVSLRDHKRFRVTIAGVKRPGAIVATVKAGAARDAAGNLSTAGNKIKVSTVASKSRKPKKPAPTRPTSPAPVPSSPASSPPASSLPATEPPVSPPASSGLIVGTIVNAAGGGTAALDKAAAAGSHWIREDLWWPDVEATRGNLDWSRYDRLFLNAANRGIHILPIIEGTPAWTGASGWAMPSDPSLYATFAGLAAARYGPGGTFWQAHFDLSRYAPEYFEIWNEPWWPQFSTPVDAGRYARLAQAAGQTIHAVNSQAKAIAATEWQYTAADGSTRIWTDDMLSAVPNLGAAVDAFAVHPYAANTSVDTWTGSNWQTAKLDRKIRPDLVSHGLGDKPIWVTEIGWPTCGSACRGFTELEQAANVARFDRLVRTEWTYVKAVFYYALNDQDGGSGDLTDREQWFGTIRRDGSFKPAYDALRAAFTA